MEAMNGMSGNGDKGVAQPPSPLTGCYLLIIVGEPYNEQHKDIILQRIAKGLLSWDVKDCMVDLEKELAIITEQALEGEEARYGERLIQFASENLVTEILIHPVVSTLVQCMRNLLSSFTRHRHIIHAGYTFAANGSWALQDGTFSYSDFSDAFREADVQRVLHAYSGAISVDVHCPPEGGWARLPSEPFAAACRARLNPCDVLGCAAAAPFVGRVSGLLRPASIGRLMAGSDVVGNIRFSRPTLYVFPGGQGDAALFGINGFNMLLDGGFSRKACFWDFVRHLDRLDAVLLTRLNNSNVGGISSILRRKKQDVVYPQIGHFFCNIQERRTLPSPDGDKDKDPLLIDLLEEGQEIISNLRHLNLHPQPCYRDSDPINLYHKVGHGTLDMYVLSPSKDSKEVKEFLQKWSQSDQKLFAAKGGREFNFPIQNLVSVAALLVWQPANPTDTITRILFPGSSPQVKVFEGLDKIKHLECVKRPTCSVKSLQPAPKKSVKDALIEKMAPKEKVLARENKTIENNIINGVQEKGVKKSDSTESERSNKAKKVEEPKFIEDGNKAKPKSKPKVRGESQQRKKPPEKKASPTTTLKKTESVEAKKPTKPSPLGTPAKSTKDANNRKVVESKAKREAIAKPPPPKPKAEPKPLAKKPTAKKAPTSPTKKLANGIQKPDSISKKGKLDKEGTTDSSTVSTPSVDQESVLKKDISKLSQEDIQKLEAQELADLKEEQEAVKEIEAVFRKGESKPSKSQEMRRVQDVSIEDKEEYIIIEKEVIEQESLEQEAKEDETQKLARDSEESEKQRRGSSERIVEPADDIPKQKEVLSPEDKQDFSSDKKTTDKDMEEEIKDVVESHPDEKISANIKSGDTTTAPTLPEDERIPLDEINPMDEIKEDNGYVVEEKHVKEETKEKGLPVIQLPQKTFESVPKIPGVVGIRLDKQQLIRDIVKTPDEVADLPVHEEVDYEYTHELRTEPTKINEVPETQVEQQPQRAYTKEEQKEVELEKDRDEVNTEAKEYSVVEKELKRLTDNVLENEKILEKDILSDSERASMAVKQEEDTRYETGEMKTGDTLEESKVNEKHIEHTQIFPESHKTVEDKKETTTGADSKDDEIQKELQKEDNDKVVEHSKIPSADVTKEEIEEQLDEGFEKVVRKPVSQEEQKVELVPHGYVEETDKGDETESQLDKMASKELKKSVIEESDTIVSNKAEQEYIETREEVIPTKSEFEKDDSMVLKESVHEAIRSDTSEKDTPEASHEANEKVSEMHVEQQEKQIEEIEKTESKFDNEISDVSEELAKKLIGSVIIEDDVSKPLHESIKNKPEIAESQKDEETESELIEGNSKEFKEFVHEDVKGDTCKKDTQKVDHETAEIKTGTKEENNEELHGGKIGEKTQSILGHEDVTSDITDKQIPKETTEIHHEILEKELISQRVTDKAKTKTEIVSEPSEVIKELVHEEVEIDRIEDKKYVIEKSGEEKLPAVQKVEIDEKTLKKSEELAKAAEEEVTKDVPDIKTIEKNVQSDVYVQERSEDIATPKDIADAVISGDLKATTISDKELQDRAQAEDEALADQEIAATDLKPHLPSDTIEKIELGRKSPKEREEDVIKIVASVAEVLKSDAPLEEFEGKLPISTFSPYTSPYTTELRETHITTVDSPLIETKVIKTDIPTIPEEPHTASASFIDEEMKAISIQESEKAIEDKRVHLLKESQEFMQATSKMLSDIKATTEKQLTTEKTEDEDTKIIQPDIGEDAEEKIDEDDVTTVHRMLVTASSEDGGEETEICPVGSIVFSKSSESSGRSSPDPSQKTQKSSIMDTTSDSLSTVRQILDDQVQKDEEIADQEEYSLERKSSISQEIDTTEPFRAQGVTIVEQEAVSGPQEVEETITSDPSKVESAEIKDHNLHDDSSSSQETKTIDSSEEKVLLDKSRDIVMKQQEQHISGVQNEGSPTHEDSISPENIAKTFKEIAEKRKESSIHQEEATIPYDSAVIEYSIGQGSSIVEGRIGEQDSASEQTMQEKKKSSSVIVKDDEGQTPERDSLTAREIDTRQEECHDDEKTYVLKDTLTSQESSLFHQGTSPEKTEIPFQEEIRSSHPDESFSYHEKSPHKEVEASHPEISTNRQKDEPHQEIRSLQETEKIIATRDLEEESHSGSTDPLEASGSSVEVLAVKSDYEKDQTELKGAIEKEKSGLELDKNRNDGKDEIGVSMIEGKKGSSELPSPSKEELLESSSEDYKLKKDVENEFYDESDPLLKRRIPLETGILKTHEKTQDQHLEDIKMNDEARVMQDHSEIDDGKLSEERVESVHRASGVPEEHSGKIETNIDDLDGAERKIDMKNTQQQITKIKGTESHAEGSNDEFGTELEDGLKAVTKSITDTSIEVTDQKKKISGADAFMRGLLNGVDIDDTIVELNKDIENVVNTADKHVDTQTKSDANINEKLKESEQVLDSISKIAADELSITGAAAVKTSANVEDDTGKDIRKLVSTTDLELGSEVSKDETIEDPLKETAAKLDHQKTLFEDISEAAGSIAGKITGLFGKTEDGIGKKPEQTVGTISSELGESTIERDGADSKVNEVAREQPITEEQADKLDKISTDQIEYTKEDEINTGEKDCGKGKESVIQTIPDCSRGDDIVDDSINEVDQIKQDVKSDVVADKGIEKKVASASQPEHDIETDLKTTEPNELSSAESGAIPKTSIRNGFDTELMEASSEKVTASQKSDSTEEIVESKQISDVIEIKTQESSHDPENELKSQLSSTEDQKSTEKSREVLPSIDGRIDTVEIKSDTPRVSNEDDKLPSQVEKMDEKVLKQEEILAESAQDLEATFETLTDMGKSIVFEKISSENETIEGDLSLKKYLDGSTEDLGTKSKGDRKENLKATSGVIEEISDDSARDLTKKHDGIEEAEVIPKVISNNVATTSGKVELKNESKYTDSDSSKLIGGNIQHDAQKKIDEQLKDSAEDINHTYKKVAQLSKSLSFEKCEKTDLTADEEKVSESDPTEEYTIKSLEKDSDGEDSDIRRGVCDKVRHEELKEMKDQLNDYAEDVGETYDKLSKLSKSISFEKCEKVDSKEMEDNEKAVESKPISKEISRNVETSPSTAKSVDEVSESSGKVSNNIEPEVPKEMEAQLEKSAEDIGDTYENVAQLSKALSFDKCEKTHEGGTTSKNDSETTLSISKSVEDKVEHKMLRDVQEQLEDSAKDIDETYENVAQLSRSLSFEKCEKVEEKENADKKEMLEVTKAPDTVEDDKSESVIFHTNRTEKENGKISQEKHQVDSHASESVTVDEMIKSYESEKGEKETMEKSAKKTDEIAHPVVNDKKIGLQIAESEIRKLSVSDVDVSLTDNGGVVQEEVEVTTKDPIDEQLTETLLPHEKHIPGVITPPTVPVSPNILEEVRFTNRTDALIKEVGLKSSTSASDEPEIVRPSEQLSRMEIPPHLVDKDSDEDDDQLSMTSQMAHSRESSHCEDEFRKPEMDPMSASFYGVLPSGKQCDQTAPGSCHLFELTQAKYSSSSIHEPERTRPTKHEGDVMSASFIGEQLPSCVSQTGDVMTASFIGELPGSSSSSERGKEDPIGSWGQPLGLPTPPTHFNDGSRDSEDGSRGEFDYFRGGERVDMMTASFYGELPSETKDPIESWGKPLGLPSPAPPADNKGTPKRERKLPANVTAKNKLNDEAKKRSESPSKYNRAGNKKTTPTATPVYVDLTYVPHHGNTHYASVDFFKRVRARYYVFSGIEPSREVYDALLEAKQTWEDRDLEVTIIPTYDTDILGYWVAENEEMLTKLKIDLSPSASRCTINLQDHETSCSAYRLEF